MFSYSLLPPLEAVFNGIAAIFLAAGFVFIRRRNITAHRACMLTAVGCSLAFLCAYLTYHVHAGDVRFLGRGLIRPVYFTILISHIILAMVIVPLVIITLWRALAGRFAAHRMIARWTLPLWLYVSVTGVVVYLMVYILYPHSPIR